MIERIDAVLPQTQCRQCGYDGCRPYAAAIASGEAKINQCPPGGDPGIRLLAQVTGLPYLPLNIAHGVHKPKALAVIDETVCIGCTLCLQACPVDAILGANKHMHTVIAAECTGCELCIAPCPVDCITMIPLQDMADLPFQTTHPDMQAADIARMRYHNRLARIEHEKSTRAAQYAARKANQASVTGDSPANLTAAHDKKAAIAAAMARAKTANKTAADPNRSPNQMHAAAKIEKP